VWDWLKQKNMIFKGGRSNKAGQSLKFGSIPGSFFKK
jgi:hypothetical protein